jgi:DNA (cytosine-5)-methyltransferase 1
LRHGSLFSGGGGFDLAAETMAWQNIFHCEKDPFCQTVLKHYWPGAETITDIKEFDAKRYEGKIDIITGGFPCQPFSAAGKRKGTEDDRYLWPDMLRIIREIRPSWVVGENVYGLVSWSEGLVFEQVQSDLEIEGYEVAAFVLPASGINAPHQRYRVWVVAYHPEYAAEREKEADTYAHSLRRGISEAGIEAAQGRYAGGHGETIGLHPAQLDEIASNTDGKGLEGRTKPRGAAKSRKNGIQQPAGLYQHSEWKDWPTQPPLCSGDDGLSTRLDGITFPKWKMQSIKMYGNAIVPQMAVRIFQAIEACVSKIKQAKAL